MKRFATPLFALALALSVWGCTSAKGAYDDALEAELSGDLATAFDRYYTALRRDADLPNARGRFSVVGRDLVAQRLAEASGAATPPRAADIYIDVEERVGRAAEVGVTLDLPTTFARDRDASFASAVAYLRDASGQTFASGDHSGALDQLNRARVYRPTASELAGLDIDARDVYMDWAEVDLAAGRFRRAYTSAEYALGFSGSDDAMLSRLQGLQGAILDAGSIRVAFFPLARPTGGSDDGERGPVGARGRIPFGFAEDMDDVLNDDHWTQPPLFVFSADPADVRRLLRGERDADDLIDRERLLGDLARDLDADLGAAFSIGLWRETDEVRSRDARSTTLRRGGTRATYDRVRRRMELGATVEYSVVDARSRIVVCEGEVEKDVRDTVTFHEYSGDYRDLAVDRDERRLFTDDYRDEVEAEMHLDLMTQLANAVAERVYSCVGRQVR